MKTTRSALLMLALLCALSTYGQTDPDAFITTWKTTRAGEAIIIPTTGSGYNYTVNQGDGGTPETGKTGDASHTYATAGTHTVSITGEFPRIYFNDFTSAILNSRKIRTIAAWGDIEWTAMEKAFKGCSNLTYTATDVPDLSGVTPSSASIRLCSLNKTNKTKKSALFTKHLKRSIRTYDDSPYRHIKKNKISFPPAGTSGIAIFFMAHGR